MAKSQLQPEELIHFISVLPACLRRKAFNDLLRPIDLDLNQLPEEAHQPIEMEWQGDIPTLTEVYTTAVA
jgi:hypothetical protein